LQCLSSILERLALDQQVVAEIHLDVFSLDPQPLEAAVLSDDVSLSLSRAVD